MSEPKHLSPHYVTLEALYQAYRKAKVDVFSERSQPLAVSFCIYERDLHSNLEKLQAILTQESPNWHTSRDFIGEHDFIPKSISIFCEPHNDSDRPHFMPSNPDDIWNIRKNQHRQPGNEHQVEFRPVARFSVDMYVTCALWVNSIGHLFDACLARSARGTRLRRVGPRHAACPRPYHITAPGSFKPYFYAYQKWREDGLNAIKRELEQRRRVVAITMDLKSFYHSIDPSFLLEPAFLAAVGFERQNQRSLSQDEILFTNQLITSLQTWGASFAEPNLPTGVPVGPSAPRIIANVLLADFDRQIEQKLDPVYYGRYVDDIFLVINDNNRFSDADGVIDHLTKRLAPMLTKENSGHDLVLTLPYSTGSKLVFQSKKQRIFPLADEVGQDLIRTIEAKIDEVSSEWRLLPDLDGWESSPAAKILSASTSATESIDSMRKADDLTLKRMSFSVMLRHHDILARDLPANEWKEERREFLRFAERHVLTPLRIFDYNDYLPRLLALAVSCYDWKAATRIVERIKYSTNELRAILGTKENSHQWAGYFRHLTLALAEAALRSFPLKGVAEINSDAGQRLLNSITNISTDYESIKTQVPHDPAAFSLELFSADLGQTPFKEWLFELADLRVVPHQVDITTLPENQRLRAATIEGFIRPATHTHDPDSVKDSAPAVPLAPFIFATRPISVREITEYDPKAVESLPYLRKLVEALRGTWVGGNSEPSAFVKPHDVDYSIGSAARRRSVRVAITSFLVEESSWARAADGRPDLSVKRYKRLARLANAIIKARPRPRYVVFPELSIPRQWLRGLTNLFIRSGISVIAGLEYERKKVPQGKPQQVVNEAYLALTDTRLGYPSSCVIRQLKGLPAHGERDNLRSGFNATFPPAANLPNSGKSTYRHFGHGFGVLICSELTDVQFRTHFRGKIDTLFVLSWNQDLESFSSLVDSTALDIHCYLVLVNNRKYGDSRVRAPAKKHWARDLVRIKGGLDDYFVVTDLDIMALRNFQSFHEPPMGDSVDFKPTPEGFQIVGWRRRTPNGGL